MINLGRDVLSCGAGAGIGVIIPEVLLKYVEPTYGATVPGVDTIIPTPWNRWSILIPIATGVPALLAGLFYRSNYSSFLFGYGISSTANGVLRGVFSMPSGGARARSMGARPRQIRPVARIKQQTIQPMMGSRPKGRISPTATGISDKIIWA